MKRHIHFPSIFLPVLVFIAVMSCKKPHPDAGDGEGEELSISQAEIFFKATIATSGKTQHFLSGADNADVEVVKTADWSRASTRQTSMGTAVIVPLSYGDADPYLLTSADQVKGVPLSALSYLMLYRRTGGNIVAEWVLYRPDAAWIAGDRRTFTGEVHVKDWFGKPVAAFRYHSDGTTERLFTGAGVKRTSVSYVSCFTYMVGYCANTTDGVKRAADRSMVVTTRSPAARCDFRLRSVIECFGQSDFIDDDWNTYGGGAAAADYTPICDPFPAKSWAIKGSPTKAMLLDACGVGSIEVEPGPAILQNRMKSVAIAAIGRLIDETMINCGEDAEFQYDEKDRLAELLYDAYADDIAADFAALQDYDALTGNHSGEPDPGIVEALRKLFRKLMHIDAPESAEEAQLISRMSAGLGTTATQIRAAHDGLMTVAGLVPGMTAIDEYLQGHYTNAGIAVTLDVFGESLVRGIVRIGGSVIRMSELAAHYPQVARSLKDVGVLDLRVIRFNASDKFIIIGQSMDRVVASQGVMERTFGRVAEMFEPSGFAKKEWVEELTTAQRQQHLLSDAQVKTLTIYRENEAWIKAKIEAGYNVIDIGRDYNQNIRSVFYWMEKKNVYYR